MIRVLVADDHALVRDAIRAHLETMGEVAISEADDYAKIFAIAEADSAPSFDLILLDLSMPGAQSGDHIQNIRSVREAFPKAKVVVLSMVADEDTVNSALQAGVAGYIPKTTRGKALILALQLVLEGEIFVPQMLAPKAGLAVPKGPPLIAGLTTRERSCLALLAGGKRNKEIARELGLQDSTVKMHLRAAFRKIGASNRADAVRIVIESRLAET